MVEQTLPRIIGGARTYEAFQDVMDKWIVTEVPLDVEDADTFMSEDFLDEFQLKEMRELDDQLAVKFYERV